MSTPLPDPILRGKLSAASEIYPPLTASEAELEANRCLYCADAPCVQACPTHIDIPGFIKKISSHNVSGAAVRILQENFLGSTCARVCPVEELCEGACVLGKNEKAISIGRLQRFATDALPEDLGDVGIIPSPGNGKEVLVIGAGPGGLSAAAELALTGHQVTIWEARQYSGGLSTYGIIPQREPVEISLKEVDYVRSLGVTILNDKRLKTGDELYEVSEQYDAVVLAFGLGSVPDLPIPGASAIVDGLEYIASAKTDSDRFPSAKQVAVIGAGNTAIDAATVAVATGAQATIVYRRRPEDMPAFKAEYEFAVGEGIRFEFEATPDSVVLDRNGDVVGLKCVRSPKNKPTDGAPHRLEVMDLQEDQSGSIYIPCDLVIRAIGQSSKATNIVGEESIDNGYLRVDENGKLLSSDLDNVFAVGDATRISGDASTVMAVQDGKKVAKTIKNLLESGE